MIDASTSYRPESWTLLKIGNWIELTALSPCKLQAQKTSPTFPTRDRQCDLTALASHSSISWVGQLGPVQVMLQSLNLTSGANGSGKQERPNVSEDFFWAKPLRRVYS
jgi:hypothetical protein